MSIRTASILISVLAHGTAYFYLSDFISLDRPSLAETSRGIKVELVRAEKNRQKTQPVVPEAASQPEITAKPPEEKVLEAEHLTRSDNLNPASVQLIEQINNLPPTVAGRPIKVASNIPIPVKKRLPAKPRVEREPETKPEQPEQLQRVAHTSVASPSDRVPVPIEVAKNNAVHEQSDHLLAIEMAYADALAAAIEKHKRYPLRARKKGQEGEVKVLFTVLEDGTISQVQIGQSSLSSILDRAASKAVESLGRFQPIPEQLGRKRWEFQVPVRFAMN